MLYYKISRYNLQSRYPSTKVSKKPTIVYKNLSPFDKHCNKVDLFSTTNSIILSRIGFFHNSSCQGHEVDESRCIIGCIDVIDIQLHFDGIL